ncbi:MAG: Na+/H+ antiporter subunit E [Phreatobacter sp.]|uniref:Na+/H+ antiporter subunit E n=1 Tax=Phreatobacter sp. TaxID=1966341 RepID=UPI002735B133|nr:Na+/H+ antiporter subunit E [Phreatobacter sp.]MDP2801540.1 Na+/H+ antiporter subunit E [Phreatobacter sp.]
MRTRYLPQPILTLVIAGVWMALANDISLGNAVLGLILGVLIPLVTQAYWPDRPRFKNPWRIVDFTLVVLWDIVLSNIQVAQLILFRRGDSLRSQFVRVPLALTNAEAITILAGTITMTPGTISADLSADGTSILVHCLETDDPEGTVNAIKERYERRLMEIFA